MSQYSTNDRIGAFAALADLLGAVTPLDGYAPLGARLCARDELPAEAAALLAHDEHMTLRLRRHYGCELRLRILAEQQHADIYSREILLLRTDTGAPVEFGIVRIHLGLLPGGVRDEILGRQRPLGDILIAHDVLRRVEPRWFYEFASDSRPARALLSGASGSDARDGGAGRPVFGRLCVIHCAGHEAIEVLEAVRARSSYVM